jgi:uncharacterized protein (DUF1800 family)
MGAAASRCAGMQGGRMARQPEQTRQAGAARARSSRDEGLDPLRDQDFGYEQARHLLNRAGFAGTPEQIRTLAEWGPERSVDYLLDASKVPFEEPKADAFDRNIMRPPTPQEEERIRMARRSQDEDALAQIQALRQERERVDRRQVREIQRWWLTRMIETPRPLEEKMTLFWHGHFATSYRTIENSYHMYLQNQFLRKHALGNFGDLLFGIIRDPAMIAYLDNNDSRKGKPNENLARELMELFSLGVGNYSENDIKEGARALTGYTFNDDQFVFVEANHDEGTKNILGKEGGLDGDGFVRAILEERACGRFMTRKFYRFFAADLPDDPDPTTDAVLRGLSATFLANRYDIKPVLRRLFLSEHFYSPGVVGQQIKSPVQLVVGSVRSLNTPVRDLSILLDALDLMGQNILFPPSVKGWDGGRSWINTSTLFVRQNILAFLLTGKKPHGYDAAADQEKYDPAPLLAPLAKASPGAERDPAQVIEYLLRFTLGRAPSHVKEPLAEFLAGAGGKVTRESLVGALLLITATPEYQLC